MAKSKLKANLLPGFLNVNKPSGMTAHDVVARLRRICGVKQIGHAGTLDPMARGVLPIAIGRACRLLRFLPDDKVYLASILFGLRTDTDDVEGKIIDQSEIIPTADAVASALKNFVGHIEQIPPMYSAIHVDGKRLYELARRGETPVEIPKRNVQVFSIEHRDYSVPAPQTPNLELLYEKNAVTAPAFSARLDLRIHCSSGTYIRSIARDLGETLGSAACLASLQRERAGLFEIQKSYSLEELAAAGENGTIAELLETPEDRLPQPVLEITEQQRKQLIYGQRLHISPEQLSSTGSTAEFIVALYQGKLVAICSKIKVEANAENSACAEGEESSIVELKPEVVLQDGSFL